MDYYAESWPEDDGYYWCIRNEQDQVVQEGHEDYAMDATFAAAHALKEYQE